MGHQRDDIDQSISADCPIQWPEKVFFLVIVRYNRLRLLEVDDGDAGAAEADVLVGKMGHTGDGREVLSDELAEDAVARAVEDADAVGADLDSVVDEVGHGLQGFVATHAAEVDVLVEMQALLMHRVGRLFAEEGGAACRGALQGGLVDALQTLRGHCLLYTSDAADD